MNPVNSGTYGETLTRAVTAIRGGAGPHFSVLLAAELHSLRDMDIIAPREGLAATPEIRAWLSGSNLGLTAELLTTRRAAEGRGHRRSMGVLLVFAIATHELAASIVVAPVGFSTVSAFVFARFKRARPASAWR